MFLTKNNDMKKKKRTFYFISFFLCLGIIFGIVSVFYHVKYPIKYNDQILAYSVENDLDPSLVASLINVESSFNANAKSSSGAIGLMQIMPKTGEFVAEMLNEEYKEENLYNAKTNIKYGCRYLKYLKEKFNDEKTVLYAYNAGEGSVKLWLNNKEYSKDGINLNTVPYKTTSDYVTKILNGQKYYKNRV